MGLNCLGLQATSGQPCSCFPGYNRKESLCGATRRGLQQVEIYQAAARRPAKAGCGRRTSYCRSGCTRARAGACCAGNPGSAGPPPPPGPHPPPPAPPPAGAANLPHHDVDTSQGTAASLLSASCAVAGQECPTYMHISVSTAGAAYTWLRCLAMPCHAVPEESGGQTGAAADGGDMISSRAGAPVGGCAREQLVLLGLAALDALDDRPPTTRSTRCPPAQTRRTPACKHTLHHKRCIRF